MISLASTKYFSPEQLKALQRRGLRSVEDVLFYFPVRYIDRSRLLDLRQTQRGELVTFLGKVAGSEIKYGRKRRLIVYCLYQGYTVELVFFQGIGYYSKALVAGTEAAFSGNLEIFAGHFSILHPEFEIIEGDDQIHTGKIIPVYKITDAMRKAYITARVLRRVIYNMLKDYDAKIHDHLAPQFREQENFLELKKALDFIHFPQEFTQVEKAKERLAFDELLFFSALMLEKKQKREKIKRKKNLSVNASLSDKDRKNKETSWPSRLKKSLPFALTSDQEKAVAKLMQLSQNPWPFGALLQGDVGSGKTLVALLLALHYAQNDLQIALMAPTEILARQHYRSFLDFLHEFPLFSLDILIGKEKVSERKQKLERLQSGQTLLLVGTHSLIQEDVLFNNLGLVIFDEQHRFGVEQRESLRSKGEYPDILSMTATPIPRSLSLTFYGDLESVIIREKPQGRLPIDTRLFGEEDILRVYKGVKKYVDQGRQTYIVYPIIDESSNSNWASLMSDYHFLETEIFGGYRLGLLHGRLSGEEKDRAMRKFKEGTIQILVATTVIEVGIDVPNATVMVIRNAEKFGLSQLHQLRGRVGRGKEQSFCILIHAEKVSDDGKQRLQAMLDSENGFYLAEKDLQIRGAGQLLGLKQAGVSEFRLADLSIHSALAEKAYSLLQTDAALLQKIMAQKNWQKHLQKGLVLFAN